MNDNERMVLEQKFKNIGFDLDFSSIEKYMYVNHTYYASLITKLNEIFETLCKVRKTALEPEKKFKFKITTNFDKRFYCAVKIADSAKELVYNPGNSSYYVTYTGDQIDEIELSYEILCNPYNYSREDMSLARDYLLEKSPSFRLDSELWAIQIPEGQAQGYSVENHPMYSIIIQLRDILNSKKNRVYECMVSEKRIPIKWVSEYRLFYFVKQLCPEAVFQFHCEWLGQQSYDIYLPEQRVAIEYQGEQHYRDVSFFKSDYDEYRRRDKRKLEISNANDVRLLYYSYESHVMLDRVKSFLKQNKVICEC